MLAMLFIVPKKPLCLRFIAIREISLRFPCTNGRLFCARFRTGDMLSLAPKNEGIAILVFKGAEPLQKVSEDHRPAA